MLGFSTPLGQSSVLGKETATRNCPFPMNPVASEPWPTGPKLAFYVCIKWISPLPSKWLENLSHLLCPFLDLDGLKARLPSFMGGVKPSFSFYPDPKESPLVTGVVSGEGMLRPATRTFGVTVSGFSHL